VQNNATCRQACRTMGGRPAGDMTAVYADFSSNGLRWNRFSGGSGNKDLEGPKIPLDKVLAKPCFWR
jgi:hypothetical protein